MSLSLNLAQSQFQAAATQAVEHTERTYPEFINGQSLALSLAALRNTEKADANRIAYSLGQVATKISLNRKTGAFKAGSRVYDNVNSVAARIINARRRERGEPLLFGREMAKAVRRFIAARMRSSAFIKSGWLPAIRGLSAVVGRGAGQLGSEARQKGQPKGYVRPARRAINSVVSAEMVNTALLAESDARTGSRKGNPMPVATRALKISYDAQARDILNHLANKLRPEFAKVSAR